MAYPSTIDTFLSVSGTTLTNNPAADHATFHNQYGTAIHAIETVLGTNNGTNLNLGSPNITGGKFDYINDTAGTHVAVLSVVGAGVNYWQIGGNTTTNPVQMFAEGSDNNVGMQFTAKGTGRIDLFGTTVNIVAGTTLIYGFQPQTQWHGWITTNESWSYSSVDGQTGVITVPSDATLKYQPGMRIYIGQNSTVKYGVITAVTSTTLTVLFNSDAALTNAAITFSGYSSSRAPFGFNCDPAKYNVVTRDTTNAQQAAPTGGNWYNMGTIGATLPIGLWRLSYEASFTNTEGAARTDTGGIVTLSTGTASESDSDFSARFYQTDLTNGGASFWFPMSRFKTINAGTKTPYYLNGQALFGGTASAIAFRGDNQPTIIRAEFQLL